MSYTPMQLAEAFIQAGELDDALEALNQQLVNVQGDEVARRLRVQVLMRLGSAAHLRQALADLDILPPQPSDGHTRSVVLERLGQPEAALAAARAALEVATDERLASRLLERVLALLREQGYVRVALELALRNDWVQWAADAAADLHNDAQAITYYTQALERVAGLEGQVAEPIVANIRARVLLKRAGAYQRSGKLDTADTDYENAAAIVPDDPMISFNRGLIAVLLGNTDQGVTLVQQALDTAPAALRALMHDEVQDDERYATLQELF